jgi:hypothetical protein
MYVFCPSLFYKFLREKRTRKGGNEINGGTSS